MNQHTTYESVATGDTLPGRSFGVQRVNLVMYAGASGDFNPIHWNERIAKAVGLPDVIAHGLFTMAQAGRFLADWAGDPGAVERFEVRFSKPVVVPDDDVGAAVDVAGTVVEMLDDKRVRVELTATSGGAEVLQHSAAVVRLA